MANFDALLAEKMTMQLARTAVWRVEFRTDMTRSGAPIIPLAFMVEADWKRGTRWLGMLYRRALTPNELKAVNLGTWPELNELDVLVPSMFDLAWAAAPGEGGLSLLLSYGSRSALHFAEQKATQDLLNLTVGDTPAVFDRLKEHLLTFEEHLQPALRASVFELGRKRRRPPPSEFEFQELARSAA